MDAPSLGLCSCQSREQQTRRREAIADPVLYIAPGSSLFLSLFLTKRGQARLKSIVYNVFFFFFGIYGTMGAGKERNQGASCTTPFFFSHFVSDNNSIDTLETFQQVSRSPLMIATALYWVRRL